MPTKNGGMRCSGNAQHNIRNMWHNSGYLFSVSVCRFLFLDHLTLNSRICSQFCTGRVLVLGTQGLAFSKKSGRKYGIIRA